MKGKIIVIEGTDCSGKATQAAKLVDKLKSENIQIETMSFPMYDTPTGQIVGGPYLGKPQIMEGWFSEGAGSVNPKVASLYYAADRLYNLPRIQELLDAGINVLIDRYSWSNFAHQGGKVKKSEERLKIFDFLEKLEFDLLGLPKPDITIFLHMPYKAALKLREGREEKADQHENNPEHLKNAEKTYLELADRYGFSTIRCADGENAKSIDEIAEKVYAAINKILK